MTIKRIIELLKKLGKFLRLLYKPRSEKNNVWKKIEKEMNKEKSNDFEEFAFAIRKRESSDNYQIVNAYGYMGAYQFGMARLCDLGYTERKAGTTGYVNSAFQWKAGHSREYFLSNSELQDRVFKEHTIDLIKQIDSRFTEYIGKAFNGVEITLSGLIAGAHLGGIGGVSNYLKGLTDAQDQLGTSISNYIKLFAGYNLENL